MWQRMVTYGSTGGRGQGEDRTRFAAAGRRIYDAGNSDRNSDETNLIGVRELVVGRSAGRHVMDVVQRQFAAEARRNGEFLRRDEVVDLRHVAVFRRESRRDSYGSTDEALYSVRLDLATVEAERVADALAKGGA